MFKSASHKTQNVEKGNINNLSHYHRSITPPKASTSHHIDLSLQI